MNSDDLSQVYIATIIEEDSLTLGQICKACNVHAEWVISLIEEGIIEPVGREFPLWRFSGVHLLRVKSAYRLQRDLGVNLAGIGLILDLMDQIENLRGKINIAAE